MKAAQLDDPREFLDRARPLLETSEARHNLLYGIVGTLIDQPGFYEDFRLWIVDRTGTPVAAAIRTLPYSVIVADAADATAAAALAEAVVEDGAELPGLRANVPTDRWFVDAWCAATGDRAELEMAQGVFALSAVERPEAPEGAARLATEADLKLVLDWNRAFHAEALPDDPFDAHRVAMAVQRRIRGEDESGIWLWDRGEPVSLTEHGNRTPHGMRIGPVYTPPRHRGRGYATALVAHQSAALLESGRTFCFLYTDLANPTSNAIYERIGYRQVAEAGAWRFDRP